jgi:8-oxo-dGTP pyrophosphatase MutT (NUDIX family)
MNEIKIFADRRVFVISDDEERCFSSVGGIGARLTELKQIVELFGFFLQSTIPEVYACTTRRDEALDCLLKQADCRFLRAAGGIVRNGDGAILLINRLGYWDLPKGKMEPDETPEITAVREVEEECGVKATVLSEANRTYHTYRIEAQTVIKQTVWFDMFCGDSVPLKPQLEENITQAVWIPETELSKYLPLMYESLKGLFDPQKTQN